MPGSGGLDFQLTWPTPPDLRANQAWGPPSPSAAPTPHQALPTIPSAFTLALPYALCSKPQLELLSIPPHGPCTSQPFSSRRSCVLLF